MPVSATPHPTHGRGSLREALTRRVVVADGAMGTMLQAADPSLDDFQGYEGCNEILNVARPELVASVHDAYFSVGVDCVETNTFGANLANLGEYDITERIYELAEAGAAIARRVAVMHLGEIVEEGAVDDVIHDPRHPYTQALRSAVPEIDGVSPAPDRLGNRFSKTTTS